MQDTASLNPCPAEVLAYLRRLGLGRERLERLDVLSALDRALASGNRLGNLTRIPSGPAFWCKHVADSLAVATVAPELLTGQGPAADVGPGAGFPLFPLAWANPRLRITGIECNLRKAAFLSDTAVTLALSNCTIIARQAREVARETEHAGRYAWVLARAVAPPPQLLRECRRLLAPRVGARLLLYSTPAACAAEFPLLEREAAKFGLRPSLSTPVELPCDAGLRQFMVAEVT